MVVLLIGIVAGLQQFTTSAAVRATSPVPGAPAEILPPSSEFELPAKALVKILHGFKDSIKDPALANQFVDSLDPQAKSPEEKLRVAMVAAELQGAEPALKRLDGIGPELPPESPLHGDIQTLRGLYEPGGGGAAAIPAAEIQTLKDHHGWFGKVAATFGKPDTDPERHALLAGGGGIVALSVAVVGIILCALVAGMALLITALVKAMNGSLRCHFVRPAPGGSVAAETVAVFVAGFILLKVSTGAVASVVSDETALWFALCAQWALIPLIFWPVARGVSFRDTMAMFGLHRGRGIAREMAAGFLGYLACLPLLLGGIITTIVLMFIYKAFRAAMGLGEPPMPHNPVLDLASGKTGPLLVIMVFLLASLWAPLVEEVVFRGALYRHLRSRITVGMAAVLTALGFGLMHGYPIIMLGPVIALGAGFALMREWRGSIIASMTAHCIHNASVLTLVIAMARLLG